MTLGITKTQVGFSPPRVTSNAAGVTRGSGFSTGVTLGTLPSAAGLKEIGEIALPNSGTCPKLDDEVAWTQFTFVRVLKEEMLTRIRS
jgi:hypothetical protein